MVYSVVMMLRTNLQPNGREIPYKIRGHSTLQYVKGKAPKFDTIALLKGENGLE